MKKTFTLEEIDDAIRQCEKHEVRYKENIETFEFLLRLLGREDLKGYLQHKENEYNANFDGY